MLKYNETSNKVWWYSRHPGVVICDIIGVLTSLSWLVLSTHWTTDVYLATLVMLYTVSGLYHRTQDREWLGKLDHIMIFHVVAITALPYWGYVIPMSWYPGGILLIVTVCILGTVVKTVKVLPRFISGLLYILASLPMVIYFIVYFEYIQAPFGTLWLVGILLYTVQLGVYTLKRPDPLHEILGYREIQHVILLMATNVHALVAVRVTSL